mmetsp:Transcript_12380/g.15354  ORF Transcript_12380/g.15354 Transcript_12380/m.15354 type:complete len:184 (+) Transcript_12380:166-717(+)
MLQSLFGSQSEEGGIEGVDVESEGISTSSLLPGSVSNWWSGNDDQNESCFPTMSYQQRLHGFGICFLLGFLMSFLSSFSLMSGNLKGFAFIYTTGNLIALAGSMFLVGPIRQIKSMCEKHRWIASTVYLGTLLLTLFFAMKGSSILIVMPFLLIQWSAGVWYCASYIPFARNAIQQCVNSLIV